MFVPRQDEQREQRDADGREYDGLGPGQDARGGLLRDALGELRRRAPRQLGAVRAEHSRPQIPLRGRVEHHRARPVALRPHVLGEAIGRPLAGRDEQHALRLADRDPRLARERGRVEPEPRDELDVGLRVLQIAEGDAPEVGQRAVQVETPHGAARDQQLAGQRARPPALGEHRLEGLGRDQAALDERLAQARYRRRGAEALTKLLERDVSPVDRTETRNHDHGPVGAPVAQAHERQRSAALDARMRIETAACFADRRSQARYRPAHDIA